jgi:DNA helicase-2/ATP-dependent DNA helicase PcrA
MNYTPEQQRAIEADNRNLQIIACAGSGKTQVIAARIVNTLATRRDEGVRPESILPLRSRIRPLAS